MLQRDLDFEEWRPIADWEGLYEGSSDGEVQSLDRRVGKNPRQKNGHIRRGRVLVQRWCGSRKPYLHVDLSDKGNGRRRFVAVHRLICEAFHGPPPFPGAQALHRDDDAENNAADNLRWGTMKENVWDKRANNGGWTFDDTDAPPNVMVAGVPF